MYAQFWAPVRCFDQFLRPVGKPPGMNFIVCKIGLKCVLIEYSVINSDFIQSNMVGGLI